MIQPDMELSDSEDEGEGGRRNRQDHKTAGKATTSAKTPEIDIPTSSLVSGNPQPPRSPHTATTVISGETVPSPATASNSANPVAGADGSEKNDSSAAMEVDTAPNPSN